MGIAPMSSGMPKSCIGTAARSAISRDRTSSDGSSCPIWRFPMRRMPMMMSRYKIAARTTAVSMASPPLVGLSPILPAHAAIIRPK